MANTNPTLNQPFFELNIENDRARKVPGAYEETRPYIYRPYHYGNGIRNLSVQEGVADPLVAEANDREEMIVYDNPSGLESYKTWPVNVNNFVDERRVQYDTVSDNLYVIAERYVYEFDPQRNVVVDRYYYTDKIREFNLGVNGGFCVLLDAGQFFVVNPAGERIAEGDIGPRGRGIAYDEPNERLFIANDSNDLFEVSVNRQNGVETLQSFPSLSGTPEFVLYEPIQDQVLVGGSNYVELFDATNIEDADGGAPLFTTSTSNTVQSGLIDGSGDIFVGESNGFVQKLDRTSGTVLDGLDLGGAVADIKLQNDGKIAVALRDNTPTLALIQDDADNLSVEVDTFEGNQSYGLGYDPGTGDRYLWDGSRQIVVHPDSRPLTEPADTLTYDRRSGNIRNIEYDSVNDYFVVCMDHEIIAHDATTGSIQYRLTNDEANDQNFFGIQIEGSLMIAGGRAPNNNVRRERGELTVFDLAGGGTPTITTSRAGLTVEPNQDDFVVYEEAGVIEVYVQEKDQGIRRFDASLNEVWSYKQFQGADISRMAVDDTHLYMVHSDPEGLVKFDKSTGVIIQRNAFKNQFTSQLELAPGNTLLGLDDSQMLHVLDRDSLERVGVITESLSTGTDDERTFVVDANENKVYVFHQSVRRTQTYNLETDPQNRPTYQATVFSRNLTLNGTIIEEDTRGMLEDITLRAGDMLNSDDERAYVVGVQRSGN